MKDRTMNQRTTKHSGYDTGIAQYNTMYKVEESVKQVDGIYTVCCFFFLSNVFNI